MRTFSDRRKMNVMYDVDLSQFYKSSDKRNGNVGSKALDYLYNEALKKYKRRTNRSIIYD